MHTYKVTLAARRGKVNIIKLIRTITGWGLKDSKDFVEREFCFDEWMDDWATFDIVIGTVQMAQLAHYITERRHRNYLDVEFVASEIVQPKEANPFDFTCA